MCIVLKPNIQDDQIIIMLCSLYAFATKLSIYELSLVYICSYPFVHSFVYQQRQLERVRTEALGMLNGAESVSFTGARHLDSPFYNKTRSYFTSCFEQFSCLGSGDYGKVFKV